MQQFEGDQHLIDVKRIGEKATAIIFGVAVRCVSFDPPFKAASDPVADSVIKQSPVNQAVEAVLANDEAIPKRVFGP